MARMNVRNKATPIRTHEGGPAVRINHFQQLRRSVMSCLLWEKEFYEDGQSILERIWASCEHVQPIHISAIAVEARHDMHLRHVPLVLLCAIIKHGDPVITESAIPLVISRVDEIPELLAMYWGGTDWRKGKKVNKHGLPHAMQRGLATAFARFDEYALAKYDRDNGVKLRDALRVIRPKPATKAQGRLWKRVLDRKLKVPDTWEVALSGGADKQETFTRLIEEGTLGYLALLRNLRNMEQAGVDKKIVTRAIEARKGAHRVLPFRYVAAARAVPGFEPSLDKALLACIAEMPELDGETTILVDVSGSMDEKLSAKSDLKRIDAAATLASIWPGNVDVYTFSNSIVQVPARRGMAGVDAVIRSQLHGATMLGMALATLQGRKGHMDRLIVITDEQVHDKVGKVNADRAYMINIASAKNGVGYGSSWRHIDGFSEGVLRWIGEVETGATDR